jgi:6-phosphofructokinase 2
VLCAWLQPARDAIKPVTDMPAIATLTLNPSIDLSTSIDRVVPTHKMRCAEPIRDAGGGGINAARVIRRLGQAVAAVYPIGGTTGELLRRLVEREGIESIALPTAHETRENVTVLERSTGTEYRFVLPGQSLSDAEWRLALATLGGLVPPARHVLMSGSLPAGVPVDFYGSAARTVEAQGAMSIVDTSGAPLAAALEARVIDLIKPSLAELAKLFSARLETRAEQEAACRQLVADKKAEAVALTLGADGAMLVTASTTLYAPAVPVEVKSTVGAGDSFLGAIISRLAAGDPLEEAFCWGVAAGSAALLTFGTTLALADDIARLRAQVEVERIR